MSGNFRKKDLRTIRTRQALINAMTGLLDHQNLSKISVNDLCEKALISRATFYVHFDDKYDLIKHWMNNFQEKIIKDIYGYDEMELEVNKFVRENARVIANLVESGDSEILDLLHDFMYAIVDSVIIGKDNAQPIPNQILLSNFCAGGMLSWLKWQVKNKFPPDTPVMNPYFYQLLECIMVCNSTLWTAGEN